MTKKSFLNSTKIFTFTALFTALVIVLSSFGISVPGGHLYFNDMVIVCAALFLDPLSAFIVGGIGAFLGDFFFYPTPMFVSLVVHGLQAIAISCIAHNMSSNKRNWIAALVGALIMIVGYTLGRTFVYANFETACIKLPFQIVQAAFGVVTGNLLANNRSIASYFNRLY